MKVAIAGAGIGGLTLGLMLHQRGIEVEIYEAVAEMRPLGVGINLLPHASQQLCQLGLEDCLAQRGIETSTLAYFNKFGQEIWREPRGRAAGYDWPQFSIHRGELQMTLLAKAIERLGADRIQLDCGVARSEWRTTQNRLEPQSRQGGVQQALPGLEMGLDRHTVHHRRGGGRV